MQHHREERTTQKDTLCRYPFVMYVYWQKGKCEFRLMGKDEVKADGTGGSNGKGGELK